MLLKDSLVIGPTRSSELVPEEPSNLSQSPQYIEGRSVRWEGSRSSVRGRSREVGDIVVEITPGNSGARVGSSSVHKTLWRSGSAYGNESK